MLRPGESANFVRYAAPKGANAGLILPFRPVSGNGDRHRAATRRGELPDCARNPRIPPIQGIFRGFESPPPGIRARRRRFRHEVRGRMWRFPSPNAESGPQRDPDSSLFPGCAVRSKPGSVDSKKNHEYPEFCKYISRYFSQIYIFIMLILNHVYEIQICKCCFVLCYGEKDRLYILYMTINIDIHRKYTERRGVA